PPAGPGRGHRRRARRLGGGGCVALPGRLRARRPALPALRRPSRPVQGHQRALRLLRGLQAAQRRPAGAGADGRPRPAPRRPRRRDRHRVRRRPDPQRGPGPAVVLRKLLDGADRGLGAGAAGAGAGPLRRPRRPGAPQRRGPALPGLRRVRDDARLAGRPSRRSPADGRGRPSLHRGPLRLGRRAPQLRAPPGRDRRPVTGAAVSTSVIVVSYRVHGWLERCLESVTGQADEVLLVDNGSPGGAVGAIGRRCGVTVETLGANRGFAAGVNAGLRRVRGDLVALLNDDAVAEPGWLASAAKVLADPTVGAVGPKILFPSRFAEIRLDEEPHYAPPDPRALGRTITRVELDGRPVPLGSLRGAGLHELEHEVGDGVERHFRWTAGSGPILIPLE